MIAKIYYILVTYLPIPSHINEMKTKPTQTAIRALTESGIVPDIIICRAKEAIDDVRKKKIETYVNIKKEYIISAPDVQSIYQVPFMMEQQKLSEKILNKLHLKSKKTPDWSNWNKRVDTITIKNEKQLQIAVIGKYLKIGNYELNDVYVSIKEALIHAAAYANKQINIHWISSLDLESGKFPIDGLNKFNGILIPGGFGSTGIEGKIMAIKFARENNVPFLGLCYGMQLAAVEFARNVCGWSDANSTEIDPNTNTPIIDIMDEQKSVTKLGGTMRLGEYSCHLHKNTLAYALYTDYGQISKNGTILERHRHRYEVNPKYVADLTSHGLVFSGYYHSDIHNADLMEFLELPNKKFFVASQAHPEFTSSLMSPNPLFCGFINAC